MYLKQDQPKSHLPLTGWVPFEPENAVESESEEFEIATSPVFEKMQKN